MTVRLFKGITILKEWECNPTLVDLCQMLEGYGSDVFSIAYELWTAGEHHTTAGETLRLRGLK